jgi:hypothetical protein
MSMLAATELAGFCCEEPVEAEIERIIRLNTSFMVEDMPGCGSVIGTLAFFRGATKRVEEPGGTD